MAKFENAGTFPAPKILGRAVRLAAGVGIFYIVFPPFLLHYEAFARPRKGWDTPGGTWWLAVLVTGYLLPHVFDVGFGFRWGNNSRYAYFGLLAVAAAADFVFYGGVWGPPLGWFIFVAALFSLGHLAASFVVAALFATPG